MSRTGESQLQSIRQTSGGSQEGLAQPKGVQTRAAIAIHLANKLKIDATMDPADIFAQYQKLIAETAPDNNYWGKAITTARDAIET